MTVTWDDDLLAKVRAAAMVGVARGTEDVAAEAGSLMANSPRSGRAYRHHGVVHKASGPGEAPAPDTGRLIGSIRTEYDEAALTGTVIIGTSYAQALEYGTAKMAPRPFARPALANKSDAVRADIADEVAAVLR